MSGKSPLFETGPVTFEANATVVGGQMVEPDAATGKIKPAASGTGKCLGWVGTDAIPTATSQTPTVPGAVVAVNLMPIPAHTGVRFSGVVPVTYSAAATFGAKLKIGATAGQVAPWVTGVDAADLIVGQCYEAAGVGAAAVGAVKLGI